MKINIFDENIKKIKIDTAKLKKIGRGCNGKVYYYKNGCIKILENNLNPNINNIINIIRNINHNNFYKIQKLYYKDSNNNAPIIAYTTPFYEPDNINILEMPTNYITDNFNDLIMLAKYLAENNIEIIDLHPGNIIIQKDKIVTIDADNYKICNGNDNLEIENRNAIRHLLSRYFLKIQLKDKIS